MMPSIQESYGKKMLKDPLTWGFLSEDIWAKKVSLLLELME